jgi:hypothetical protein
LAGFDKLLPFNRAILEEIVPVMKKKSINKLTLRRETLQTLDARRINGGDDSTPYTGPGGPGGTNDCSGKCTNTCYTRCDNVTCTCSQGWLCNLYFDLTGDVLSMVGVTCRQAR